MLFIREIRSDQNFLDEPEKLSVVEVESGTFDVENHRRRTNGSGAVADSELMEEEGKMLFLWLARSCSDFLSRRGDFAGVFTFPWMESIEDHFRERREPAREAVSYPSSWSASGGIGGGVRGAGGAEVGGAGEFCSGNSAVGSAFSGESCCSGTFLVPSSFSGGSCSGNSLVESGFSAVSCCSGRASSVGSDFSGTS